MENKNNLFVHILLKEDEVILEIDTESSKKYIDFMAQTVSKVMQDIDDITLMEAVSVFSISLGNYMKQTDDSTVYWTEDSEFPKSTRN